MKFHAYGDADDVYCPRCKSADVRFFTFTSKGKEYECRKCDLRFWVVQAAVWDEELPDDGKTER
jgi:hypothetical protein